jgi:hypothetical protein
MKIIYSICLLLAFNTTFAQYIEKKWFDKADSVYGYYTVIPPLSNRVQGALLLLDGFGGNADQFFSETKIHNVSWNNDILTVAIPTGMRLYADKSMIDLLNRISKEVADTWHLRKDQFAIGGMSSGGTIALRYAELCHETPTAYPVSPKAVFIVDSPVDLIDLYKSEERDLEKNNGGWWLGENRMIIDRFKTELGDPSRDIAKYKAVSPMLREGKDSTNEKWLKDIAVRTYHDVDISWHLQNRGRSFYETNMLNGSELISRLVRMGNKQAEFVASKIPGRRSNGQRHPHTWGIVDETDLVQWIKEKLNFYPANIAVPFFYNAPANWGQETILFPIDFAPGLSYKGFEELRFAPGWGNADSNEKWAYTILWWLDGKYDFDEKVLQHDLESYFSGLTKRRAVADKLDMNLYKPAKAVVEKIKTAGGDKQTFQAVADIFDAQVTRKPGKLWFKIHVKECNDSDRTIVLLEVAANPYTQAVWNDLDAINNQFKCKRDRK